MTTDAGFAAEYESLADVDEALDAMMRRLREILRRTTLSQDAFVEISAIYNNVSYVFLYLESNEVHIDYQRVLPWRDAFYKDPELDAEILRAISPLRCAEEDVEAARQAYVGHLSEKLRSPGPDRGETAERLQAEAKSLLAAVQRDQHDLLVRLKVPTGTARSAAAFYKLVSRTPAAATRTRLNQAWTRTRDRRLPQLTDVVDRMVDARRVRSAERGHGSVLAETLTRCRVGEREAAACLDRYLEHALASHEALSGEIHGALGTGGDAMDHFGYYVRTLLGDRRVPTFALDECLDFAFLVARRAFGIDLTRNSRSHSHVISVDATRDGRRYGQIRFDLWDSSSRPRAANTTRGMRNRTDWAGLVQEPVAYVSCRFTRSADGGSRINFQNMHSLFHEVGHAVNHLLIRKRLPNQSGLEYLPLERLENLSMWFEKWVYHPDLARHLTLTGDDAPGLALAQQVKMLEYRRTHVERAVTAALDFEVHRRARGGLRDAFAALDERFGVSRHCSLGDFPVYFTWPMFQAHPGANFAYLWGAADSAEKFAPLLGRRIEDLPPPERVRAMFSSCFDYDEPTTTPDVGSVFGFYDSPQPAGREPNR